MKEKNKGFGQRLKQKIRIGVLITLGAISGATVFRTMEPAGYAQPSDHRLDIINYNLRR